MSYRVLYRNNWTEGIKHLISLSNAAQYLLINTASVEWLIDKVSAWQEPQFDRSQLLHGVVDRFRGNLIVHTDTVLQELEWKTMAVGRFLFFAEGPCSRCQMICIDQHTGEKTTEPLRTIAREFKGKMRFGLYLSLDMRSHDNNDDVEQFICCNDEITITLWHLTRFIFGPFFVPAYLLKYTVSYWLLCTFA